MKKCGKDSQPLPVPSWLVNFFLHQPVFPLKSFGYVAGWQTLGAKPSMVLSIFCGHYQMGIAWFSQTCFTFFASNSRGQALHRAGSEAGTFSACPKRIAHVGPLGFPKRDDSESHKLGPLGLDLPGGDCVETAVNIGSICRLVNKDCRMYYLTSEDCAEMFSVALP